MSEAKEHYLGDGVYASFDGYQIWLRTPRDDGEHRIALEYGVFRSLLRYGKNIWEPDDAEERAI